MCILLTLYINALQEVADAKMAPKCNWKSSIFLLLLLWGCVVKIDIWRHRVNSTVVISVLIILRQNWDVWIMKARHDRVRAKPVQDPLSRLF